MDDSTKDIEAARREGWKAFCEGYGIGACRAQGPLNRASFRSGWMDARAENARKARAGASRGSF